ncbi:MAG: DegQ family serine endoprotease [Nitrospirae bacterium]|nr:DegQ family serine endoprotease [Nitrospirota bacterium]
MVFKNRELFIIRNFKKIRVILGFVFSLNFLFLPYVHARDSIPQESIDILIKTGQAIAEIVEEVKPSIVHIYTTRTITVQRRIDPFFDDPFSRRFFGEEWPFRVPRERKTLSLGSGVIVDSKGYILTTNHVVQGAEEIRVTLVDKREFEGKIVGTDPMTDIAVIKIEAENLPTIRWGDSDKMRVGETVLAVGSPYGLIGTVTMGIVSAVGRANVGIADYEDFIQTDSAINPGNSGGALVNVRGELVGINTAIFSITGGFQGIGFAIPSNMANTVMDSLIKKGKVVRGWLGVTVQGITPELAMQFDLKEEKGALVSDVLESSPAEKAGIKRGDVIIEYEGKRIEESYQLRNMVANTTPGKEVGVIIIRDNVKQTKKVVIGELPSDTQKASIGEYENLLKGVTVRELTEEIYRTLNLPKKLKGVIVTAIDENSPAAMVLMRGDVIQEINRMRINNVRDYEQVVSMIEPGKDMLLLIFRGGSSLYITLSIR